MEHLTCTDDAKASHLHLVEVPIPGDQGVRVGRDGQRDEVVVVGVIRDGAGWSDRILELNPFVRESPGEGLRLLPRDPVLRRDAGMEQGLADLVDELRADDQLEVAGLPQVEELGRGAGGREGAGDEAIGIDDDTDGQGFLSCPRRLRTS